MSRSLILVLGLVALPILAFFCVHTHRGPIAALMAAGKWDEVQTLQDRLKGGREV